MTRKSTPEDYKVLDLRDDATADEAKRAYHRMKALYAEGSLATYSLMEGDQRIEVLRRIERAYMRISQDLRAKNELPTTHADPQDLEKPNPPAPGEKLGSYLRQRREALGYTIQDVAKKTRIRSTYLDHIENERFKDLPAPVYLRGFILEYTRLLGLPEPEKITRRYLKQAETGED